MLENIRKIGLFMIAAQAVIHFAPGRQYEKYIKLISSVIILSLFIKPFVSKEAETEMTWRTGMEQAIEEFWEEELWQAEGQSAGGRVLEQLEEEIKSRINNEIPNEMYRAVSVSLLLDGDAAAASKEGYALQLQKVEIVMAKQDEERIGPVLVEEIVIGDEKKEAAGAALQYQEIAAGILGIEPDRVEVTCVGGW